MAKDSPMLRASDSALLCLGGVGKGAGEDDTGLVRPDLRFVQFMLAFGASTEVEFSYTLALSSRAFLSFFEIFP